MSKYKIVDLFAGVGGLSYGFSKLDEFEIIMANEIETDISKAYSLNHPYVNMINCDINDLVTYLEIYAEIASRFSSSGEAVENPARKPVKL